MNFWNDVKFHTGIEGFFSVVEREFLEKEE